MRISARHVVLATTVVGLWIGSVTVAQASMPMAVPPPTADSGDLSTSPSTFFVGDTITITANFADSQKSKVVTFFKETSPGSGGYEPIGEKTANSSGNASLTGYTINETQKVFARTSAGKATEVDTLTPRTLSGADGLISACADRDDGELSLLFSTACSSSEKLLTWNAKGIQGDKGDKGDKGDPGEDGTDGKDGAQGPPGPAGGGQGFFASDGTDTSFHGLAETVIVSEALPAGKYIATGTILVENRGDTGRRAGVCKLGSEEVVVDLPEDRSSKMFTILAPFDAGGGATLSLTCSTAPIDENTLWSDQARISAVKVESIG